MRKTSSPSTRPSPKRTKTSKPAPAQLVGVSLPRRLAAGLIDFLIVAVVWVGLGLLGSAVGGPARGLLLVAVAMPLLYFVVGEAYYQTTVGKRLLGLEVVTVDGGSPELLVHIVRAMTRVPEAMMIVPYVIVIPFSQRHQRFGDMITETLVVKRGGTAGGR